MIAQIESPVEMLSEEQLAKVTAALRVFVENLRKSEQSTPDKQAEAAAAANELASIADRFQAAASILVVKPGVQNLRIMGNLEGVDEIIRRMRGDPPVPPKYDA